MKLPYKTVTLLDDICSAIPEKPYAACNRIQAFLRDTYSYGCNENILQRRWMRYPHEIKSTVNCNDAGIFSYLLANHHGLDASLAVLDGFDGTEQSHFATVVRTSRNDYMIHMDSVSQFCLPGKRKKRKKESAPEELKYKKITYLDVSDVLHMIKDANHKDGIYDFFRTGQLTKSTYIDIDEIAYAGTVKVFYGIKSLDDGFFCRKTFCIPTLYMHGEQTNDKTQIVLSADINNLTIERPYVTNVGKREKGLIRFFPVTDNISRSMQAKLHRALVKAVYSGLTYASFEKQGMKKTDKIYPMKFPKKLQYLDAEEKKSVLRGAMIEQLTKQYSKLIYPNFKKLIDKTYRTTSLGNMAGHLYFVIRENEIKSERTKETRDLVEIAVKELKAIAKKRKSIA